MSEAGEAGRTGEAGAEGAGGRGEKTRWNIRTQCAIRVRLEVARSHSRRGDLLLASANQHSRKAGPQEPELAGDSALITRHKPQIKTRTLPG